MAMSDSERQFLDRMVEDSNVNFSAADRDALVAAGFPLWCLFAAATKFVRCGGPSNPDCVKQLAQDVLACF